MFSFGGAGTRRLTSAGGTDVFLAKYDHNANLSWVISAGGSAKTVTGNAQTIFLAKYNPSGVLLWVQTGVADFGGSNNGYGVAIDSASGSVYMTGMGQGDIAFSASDATTHTVPGVGTWHMFLAKYDTAGHSANRCSPFPTTRAMPTSRNTTATAMPGGSITWAVTKESAYDNQNNLLLAGIFSDSINIDGHVYSSIEPTSLFVAKFAGSDPSRPDWVRTAGGPGVSGLENDPRIEWHDGQTRVTGTYETVARFDHIRSIGLGDWDGFVGALK